MRLDHTSLQALWVTVAVLAFGATARSPGTAVVERRPAHPIDATAPLSNCAVLISTDTAHEYELTSPDEGVAFDLDGDGVLEHVGWTRGASDIAFLAMDRDGDGRIRSGRELFGDHTTPDAKNGFAALAQTAMSLNGGVARGSVSADDPLFAGLLLWTDRNHNGISESSELRPAAELLSDIGLGYRGFHGRDPAGNHLRFQGWVRARTAPGRNQSVSADEDAARRRNAFDVCLMASRSRD